MVEVFKTNIQTKSEANIIVGLLQLCFPYLNSNIDLYDCDKVLRVETNNSSINMTELITYIRNLGYAIEPLNY